MRVKLSAKELDSVQMLLDEAILTIEGNMGDERFDPMAAREVTVKVKIQRDKKDPELIDVVASSKLKLPDRLGKVSHAVMLNDELVLERYPEQENMFTGPRKVNLQEVQDAEGVV